MQTPRKKHRGWSLGIGECAQNGAYRCENEHVLVPNQGTELSLNAKSAVGLVEGLGT